jgi:hypothetical protein
LQPKWRWLRGTSSLDEALCAFAWDATPQGSRYWQEIFEKVG